MRSKVFIYLNISKYFHRKYFVKIIQSWVFYFDIWKIIDKINIDNHNWSREISSYNRSSRGYTSIPKKRFPRDFTLEFGISSGIQVIGNGPRYTLGFGISSGIQVIGNGPRYPLGFGISSGIQVTGNGPRYPLGF